MNRVNPPKQVVLPVEIQQNPSLKKAFDDAYFIMFQLWKRTGGGDDFIANSDLSSLFSKENKGGGEVEQQSLLNIYHPQAEQDDFFVFPQVNNEEVTEVSGASFTTTESMTVVCNNAALITVSLNSEPEDNETVTVKRLSTGVVNITGSVNIDGLATQALSVIYDSMTVKYIGSLDIWIII